VQAAREELLLSFGIARRTPPLRRLLPRCWEAAGGWTGSRSPHRGLLPPPCEKNCWVPMGYNYLSGCNMFIFRHANVSWGHGLMRSGFVLFATSKEGCLTVLECRAGDGVPAASNTCGSVLITSWGWLSCNDKELGLFIKKRCLFCYCVFAIKAVGERRGDAKMIVGVATEDVHHCRDICTIRFNSSCKSGSGSSLVCSP